MASDSDNKTVQQRWADPRSRDDLTSFIARDLSKTGSLSGYSEELRILSSLLSPEDAIALYVSLRDLSSRLEFEWRDQFIGFFPESKGALPAEQISEAEFRKALSTGALRPVHRRPAS